MKRIEIAISLLLLGGLAAIMIPNLYRAMQRARQKRTTAEMQTASWQIERRQKPTRTLDAWGRPMRFRLIGPHYSIRSAAADGKFETGKPRGYTKEFADDIVLVNGVFAQYPEGLCADDRPGEGPLGNCAACHPRHVQKRYD